MSDHRRCHYCERNDVPCILVTFLDKTLRYVCTSCAEAIKRTFYTETKTDA